MAKKRIRLDLVSIPDCKGKLQLPGNSDWPGILEQKSIAVAVAQHRFDGIPGGVVLMVLTPYAENLIAAGGI